MKRWLVAAALITFVVAPAGAPLEATTATGTVTANATYTLTAP